MKIMMKFIDKHGEYIAITSVILIIIILSSMALSYVFNQIHIVNTEEVYMTATITGYNERWQQQGLYDNIKLYYVEFRTANGELFTVENERMYMKSNIGDIYNIEITNHYNKYNELVEYKIKLIGKDENE